MSFGRKGLVEAPRLTPGQAMALRAMPAPSAEPPQATVSPQLAAFLAAERGNGSVQPGLSEIVMEAPRGSSINSGAPISGGGSSNQNGHTTVIVERGERLMILAYVLWWFAAPLGAHRHYLGAHVTGFAQMGLWIGAFVFMLGGAAANSTAVVVPGLTLMVGAVLWFFVDAFLIPGMLREYNERPSAVTFA